MKFNTALISTVAVLSQGIMADYYNDQYYHDDGAQDYLGRYNVKVPRAEDYAAEVVHEPKIKRCPLTGKVLKNLYGDDDEEVEEVEEKVYRCPITGKIIKHFNDDDLEEDAAEDEEEEVVRCPITGKIIKKEKGVHRCPITGKIIKKEPEVHRCPITGKIIKKEEKKEG